MDMLAQLIRDIGQMLFKDTLLLKDGQDVIKIINNFLRKGVLQSDFEADSFRS